MRAPEPVQRPVLEPVTGFDEVIGLGDAMDLGEDTGPLTRIGAGLLTMTGAGAL